MIFSGQVSLECLEIMSVSYLIIAMSYQAPEWPLSSTLTFSSADRPS